MGVEDLRGLKILVISPNEWGDMRVSKHHYAAALAERGNEVFFLNPPDARAHLRFSIEDVAGVPGLYSVSYRPFVPFVIRFWSRPLFNVIAAAHARWLLERIGVTFDVVWCFDVNLYSDLRWFRAPLKIFHPVDQVSLRYQIDVAASADIVLSVSNEILRNLQRHNTPNLRVEHGLAPEFIAMAERRIEQDGYQKNEPLQVGYVGNLLMRYIDRGGLLRLIAGHSKIAFHFWGPRTPAESNVGSDGSSEAEAFVRALEGMPNVVLHGPQPTRLLVQQIADVDLLLMCYSISRDPNRGCNSHKILEYLSTGRVIVSNYVSDYSDKPGLIEMMGSSNDDMTELFAGVVSRIVDLNDRTHRRPRLAFALDNSYCQQIDRIASFASDVITQSRQHRAAASLPRRRW